jgi:CheY-like chemotaxis protein
MTDDLADFLMTRPPTAARPLLGLTVLVVEDSRFACEALRLMCLRSGARIRRADCLRSARRHLQVYRPTVAIIDLGLPDGSGADLLADLAVARPRVPVLLGTSGDDRLRGAALAAGADGFLGKPLESLLLFQEAILTHLPEGARPDGPRLLPDDRILPDPIALRDDLTLVADMLSQRSDASTLDYIAGFLSGIARAAHDHPLEAAASALADGRALGREPRPDISRITGLVRERLAEGAVF